MIVYKVARPFVSYGMYRAVGEVITDASLIDNLVIKIHDGTILAIDTSKKGKEPEVAKPAVKAVPKATKAPEVKQTVRKSVASKAAHTTIVKNTDK